MGHADIWTMGIIPERVLLSVRSGAGERANEVAKARERACAAGVSLRDLSDSNPTRHGLFDQAFADLVAGAARRAVRYDPDPRGAVRAREALAARFGGQPGDYWLTAGTSDAYGWLFSLLTDPGDRVAVPRPGYPLVEPLARLAGAETAGYPAYYLHPHGWEYDLDALALLLRDQRLKAVVAVHPNNPTGAYADAGIADKCAATGTPLIVDEVFAPFALDAPFPGTLAGREDVLAFALDGVSKMLASPQFKLGWIRLCGPARDVARVAPVLDRVADAYLPVSAPVADALPELLNLADATIARIRERLRDNLRTTREFFGDAPYRVRRCDGGWTALIDVPRVMDDDALIIALIERGLFVHPGWFYDLDSTGTLALSLLPEPDAFADNCRILRDALASLG